MDLAITGTRALTMCGDGIGAIEDAAIGIDDGELVYVGSDDGFDPTPAAEVVDGTDSLVIPGLVDAHAHMRLTLLRGGAQDVPEIEWMNDALAPLARHLGSEDEILGARLGAIEAIRAGATTICEYAGNVGTLLEHVYEPLGPRVVASETINEIADDRDDLGPRTLPTFDRNRGETALERTETLFDEYADHDRISVTYAPQAVDMVSPETLREISRRSDAHDRDVHVHLAQGERERLQIEERYGADESSVSLVEGMGLANERLIAAHLHDATSEERARLADAGVRMVGCPGSIGAIDGVVPPVLEYLEHGGIAGLGTDQAPGTGRHDVLREARTAALLTKCDRTDPRALPAWRALRLATIGGARALGLDDRVGTLEEGKRADLAIVALDAGAMVPSVNRPLKTYVPNLVHAAGGSAVESVIVDGEFLVRDGEFLRADPDAIYRRAGERAREIFDAASEGWRAADSALVGDVDAGKL